MVRIVEGSQELFDGLAFGRQHPGTISFLENAPRVATERLTAAGSWFIQQTQQLLERVANSDAVRMAKAAQRMMAHLYQEDTIRPMRSIGDLQHPPNAMLRWLGAEPTVGRLIDQQALDGWSGRYTPRYAGQYGEQNYDYRRVMDGLIQTTTDEDGEENWKAVCYVEDLHESTDDLDLYQQDAIVQSWTLLKHQAQHGDEDPTSPWNASL